MFCRGIEALPDVREGYGGPPVSPGVVGRPFRKFGRLSRMSGSGQEALPDVREWLGVPPGCPCVVGSPSRMSESYREALPDVREW